MNNDYLIGDCIARAHAVEQIAESLAMDEFPAEEPRSLAVAVGGLSRLIAQHLVEVRHSATYAPEKSVQHIRVVNGSLEHLSELLRYVDGAVTQKVPWSIVDPLQEVARRLVPGATIMLRPKWRYNYAIVLEDLAKWMREEFKYMVSYKDKKNEIDQLLGHVGGSFYIVSFPNIERKSVLLHAVLGHEIGHLVVEKFLASRAKDILPASLYKQIVASVDDEVKSEHMLPYFRDYEVSKRLGEVTAYRTRAIEEIGADMVGVNMLGPAALFGYYACAQTMAPNQPPSLRNDRYPPWVFRLRQSLDQLEGLGYGNLDAPSSGFLKSFKAHITEIEALANRQEDVGRNPLVKVAYEWVDQTLPKLKEYVKDVCTGKSLVQEPLRLWKQATSLAQRLRQDLPPNTLDDTADPPSPATTEAILNSGWLYRLAYLEGCPGGSDQEAASRYRECRDKLDRLTLRGLELAHLQREYEARKKRRQMS